MDFFQEENKRGIIAVALYDLDVRKIEAELSGSGDEGAIDHILFIREDDTYFDAFDADKVICERLKGISMPFEGHDGSDALEYLRSIVTEDASDQGNWYDGDGGQVNSQYIVTATTLETNYVALTQFEPDDFDDEFDEDEDEDLDAEDDTPQP